MFLSHLKAKPRSSPSAKRIASAKFRRAGESRTGIHAQESRNNRANDTRGAIGTLVAIALVLWFIAIFLLAGPETGISQDAGNAGETSGTQTIVHVPADPL
ncbi:MAG: hypothetical protein ACLFRG_04090 [Desulfococcaceae bacterium]